jgi:cell division protein FtsB
MDPKKQTLRYKRELYYIFLIVVVGGILVLSIFGPKGYLEMKKTRTELQRLENQVESLRKSNAEKQENIKALKSDPKAIEGLAREKNYGRENEIIERLPKDSEQEPNTIPPNTQ